MSNKINFGVRRVFLNHGTLASRNVHLGQLQSTLLAHPELAAAFHDTFGGPDSAAYKRSRDFFIAAGQGDRGREGRQMIRAINERLESPEGRAAFIAKLQEIKATPTADIQGQMRQFADMGAHVPDGGLIAAFKDPAKYARDQAQLVLRGVLGNDAEMSAIIAKATANKSFMTFIQTPNGQQMIQGMMANSGNMAAQFGLSEAETKNLVRTMGKDVLTKIAAGEIDLAKMDEAQLAQFWDETQKQAIETAFAQKLETLAASGDADMQAIAGIIKGDPNLQRAILNAYTSGDETAVAGLNGILAGKGGDGSLSLAQLRKLLEDPDLRETFANVLDKVAETDLEFDFVNKLTSMWVDGDKAGVIAALNKEGIEVAGASLGGQLFDMLKQIPGLGQLFEMLEKLITGLQDAMSGGEFSFDKLTNVFQQAFSGADTATADASATAKDRTVGSDRAAAYTPTG